MLPAAAFLHQRLAVALIALGVILGLWGGVLFLTRRAISGGFRSTYLLMTGLVAVQGVLGLAAFAAGGRPREILHLVYGAFAVLFLPGVFTYAGRRAPDTEAMLLTLSCWVVLIAFGRGLMTGA